MVTNSWAIAALLAFSVAYAALRYVHPARPPQPRRPGLLAAAVLAIAVSSFAVWQRWPVIGDALLNLRWAEWPQGVVLFALGVHSAETGWLGDLPPVLARRLGQVAAAGVAALMILMLYLVLARGKDQALAMAAEAPTMAFALLDGVIAVTGTLWFLCWLRHRWPAHGVMLGKAARASYATYVIHPLVLTSVMVALASVALQPEIKVVLVAAGGRLLHGRVRADPGAGHLESALTQPIIGSHRSVLAGLGTNGPNGWPAAGLGLESVAGEATSVTGAVRH